MGDLDGDGDLDLVTGNSNQVSRVYLSNGNGTFAAGNNAATPTNGTTGVSLGDVDGDGDLDFVTGNGNQVNRVYLGTGIGTFAAGSNIDTPTNNTFAVGLGDVDGDGDLDFVSGNSNQVNRVYLGNGNGTFASGNDVDTPTNNTFAVSLGDIDGDGDMDLVMGNSGQANPMHLGNGNGTFASGSNIDTPTNATQGVSLGDLDGDGDLDFVSGNSNQVNRVYLNSNTSVSSSAPAANAHTGATTTNVGVTFNKAMNAATASTFIVYGGLTGKRSGTYSGGSSSTLTFDPTIDFKPGERVDITLTPGLKATVGDALQPGHVHQFRAAASTGPAVFTNASQDISATTNATWSVPLGDLDGDGDLDLITGNNAQVNRVYLSDGDGTYAPGSDVDTPTNNTRFVSLGDLDGDGDLDIAAANYGQVNRVYLSNGNGTFATGSNVDTPTNNTYVSSLGDLDGDGDLDLVTGNYAQANRLYLSNGNGTFASGSNVDTPTNNTRYVTLGDLDLDGDLDLITGNANQVNRLYLGTGTGTFAVGSNVDTPTNATFPVSLGDLDGDGDLDLIAGNVTQVNRVYLGNGNGTFASGTNIDTPTNNTRSMQLGDVDGDGDLDIIAVNYNALNRMYLSNGNGTFATGSDVDTPTNATTSASIGDIDGDGDLDLVVGNTGQLNRAYLNSNTSLSSSSPTANADNAATTSNISATFNKAMNAATTSSFIVHGGMTGKRSGTYSGGGTATLTFDPTNDFRPNEVVEVTVKGGLKSTAGDALQPSHVHQFRAAAGVGPVVFTNSSSDVETGTSNNTAAVSLGDLDGDGDLDLITSNSGQVDRVYLGNGNGTFAAGSDVETGTTNATYSTPLGDLDGDGDLDLISGNNGQVNRVYLNSGNKDGTLTASATLDESSALALPSTATSSGAAVDLLDFTLTDGGGGDGFALVVSQIAVNTSGTGPFSQVAWRLNGPDASNVSGTYNAGTNKITFSGLSISVADGANETYTVRGYYSTNTNLTDQATFSFSLDGDTDLTTGTTGSSMSGANAAVSNAAAAVVGVTATQLAFTTQPAPLSLISGKQLDFTTDPVVTPQDAVGNVDLTPLTVTLAENGAGSSSFSSNAVASVSGVATFSGLLLTYNATDGSSIALTASASGVTGATSSSLAVDASPQVARNRGARTSEGGTAVLSSEALSFTEAISTAAEIVYTLGSAPQAGQLVSSGNVLATGSTFTQDDIDQVRISYRHSGADTFTDSFLFSAKGKPGVPTNSIGFAFEIDPVNDPPALDVLREVQVDEGGSVVISNGYLRVLDGESHASKVNYTVHSGPFHGSLGRNTFSQADIDQSLVRYLHDGSETLRDSLLFSVADGNGSELIRTWLRFAVRAINDGPIIPSIGTPNVNEGQLLVLDLTATDPEGSPIQTTVSGLPTGATLDGTMLKWLPLYDQAGTYPLGAIYDDGQGGISRLRIDIQVGESPLPVLMPDPALLDFGDVPAGQTAERSFSLVNQTQVALELAPFASTSANLSVLSPAFPVGLDPAATVDIAVRFAATNDRADLQQAQLLSSTRLGPVEVPVIGRSVWRRLVADYTEITFLPAVIGDTRWKHLTLSNPGNLPLEVAAQISSDSPFGIEPAAITLPGGEKAIMRVRFVPVIEESVEALLALTSELGQMDVHLHGQGREREEGRVTIDFNLANGNQQQSLVGDAIPGSVYVLQLHAKGAPQASGWSVRVDYDSDAVSYVVSVQSRTVGSVV